MIIDFVVRTPNRRGRKAINMNIERNARYLIELKRDFDVLTTFFRRTN